MVYTGTQTTFHVIALDDDLVQREILEQTCRILFPEARYEGFSDADSIQLYIENNVADGDECIIISDYEVENLDPVQNGIACANAIRAHGATVEGIYFVSGSVDRAIDAAHALSITDPTIPTFGADKAVGAGGLGFRATLAKHQHEHAPHAQTSSISDADIESLKNRKIGIASLLNSIETPLIAISNILHAVSPVSKEPSLEVVFKESRGIPAQGSAAFSYADLEANHARGEKSVLIVERFTKDMIPYLTKGYVSGVVCGHADLPGHIPQLLAGYGIPSLVTAESHDAFEKLQQEFPAGSVVTLDPAQRKLYTAECILGDKFTGLFDPEASKRILRGSLSEFPKKQKAYSTLGIHVPSFEICASNWDNLALARELNVNVGLVRSEFFLLKKPDPMIKGLLFGEGARETHVGEFEDRCRTFMQRLADFSDVSMKLRLIDIKAEEFLSPEDQRHWKEIPEAERKRIMMSVTQTLHQAQMGVFAESYVGKEEKNAPTLTIPFDDRVSSFLSVSRDFRNASHQAGHTAWAKQEMRPCAMIESLEACHDIEKIAVRATSLSIGGNDLATAILGVSRYDDEARLKITRTAGMGRDPFRTIYPQEVAVIEDMVRRARAVNPDIRVNFCGDQAADLDSIWRLRNAGIDTFTIPPTKECIHVLPWEVLAKTGKEHMNQAEAELAYATRVTPKYEAPALV